MLDKHALILKNSAVIQYSCYLKVELVQHADVSVPWELKLIRIQRTGRIVADLPHLSCGGNASSTLSRSLSLWTGCGFFNVTYTYLRLYLQWQCLLWNRTNYFPKHIYFLRLGRTLSTRKSFKLHSCRQILVLDKWSNIFRLVSTNRHSTIDHWIKLVAQLFRASVSSMCRAEKWRF